MNQLATPTAPRTVPGGLRIGRHAATPPPAQTDLVTSDGWLSRWCTMDTFEERIAAINTLSKKRLPSHVAAEVWLHLMSKITQVASAEAIELLVREFIMLAPEHLKACAMYDTLMNGQAPKGTPPGLVFMITSCQRYMPQARRVLADLQRRGANASIVIGDPTLRVSVDEGELVRLPVSDSYEALLPKVLEGLTFMRRRHGAGLSVVKIDDDMHLNNRFDPEALLHTARSLDYAGHAIGDHAPDRCWHLGKTSTPTPVFTRRHQGRFAYGPMYLLGPRAIEHLVREWVFYPGEFAGQIYEDRAVGDSLRSAHIEVKALSFADMGGIIDQVERYVGEPQ